MPHRVAHEVLRNRMKPRDRVAELKKARMKAASERLGSRTEPLKAKLPEEERLPRLVSVSNLSNGLARFE